VFIPMDVHSRNLWQKAENGKFTGSEATTRFPRASCFEEPTRSVTETWGRMYNVLAWSLECQWYEKWDKKSDSRAAGKGAKKLVSSNFAKILEVATKIRETCEKTLFTPPSPIKATNSIVSV
jgi:hypothetical protein